MIEKD